MKITFTCLIEKFGSKGEKTGWTYILVPAEQAEKVNAGVRVSFRVKGMLDRLAIEQCSLIPMGDGDFILPLNAGMRKKLHKKVGDTLQVSLSADHSDYSMNDTLMECISDDPIALERFTAFPPSHQRYFSKWVDSAKTEATIARRVAAILQAMHLNQNYAEMIRSQKGLKQTPH